MLNCNEHYAGPFQPIKWSYLDEGKPMNLIKDTLSFLVGYGRQAGGGVHFFSFACVGVFFSFFFFFGGGAVLGFVQKNLISDAWRGGQMWIENTEKEQLVIV